MIKISSTEALQNKYPEKFAPLSDIYSKIKAGDRIFISTGCGEPQYLVRSLVDYVESHPKAFYDTEILQVWTLGVTPYYDETYKNIFRQNSFFISHNSRLAVNLGLADYTPIFLSEVPAMFRNRQVPIDVALIQVSLPDRHGFLSLGISLDITRAAAESAKLVIAQINKNMPRVHGDTFIHAANIDHFVPFDEPLLEFTPPALNEENLKKIGRYTAQIVEDGDTIQIGYGSVPNGILASFGDKRDLGVHSEMLGDGLIELIKKGVVTNRLKSRNRGVSTATFCMGSRQTYSYLNDNPAIELKEMDYTNDPLVIAAHERMTAINSALEIDLSGQATAESLGSFFYSGIGGQANFMRGAVLAKGGKNILALQSTTRDGAASRIVPGLKEGAGVTLTRGDIHYVVTEYGIAHLHGKNIRERAMSLIAIAHPKFRPWLIKEAKERRLIYEDQLFVPGERGQYPEHLEAHRTTGRNVSLFMRPVKISDEPLIKEFYYALSDKSFYNRFMTIRRQMSHEELQKHFTVIDYSRKMAILAVKKYLDQEVIAGIAEYYIGEDSLSAEVSIVVRDDFQGKGIGFELLQYLVIVAKGEGLHTFTANVLPENLAVIKLIDKLGLRYDRKYESGLIHIVIYLK